jgi:nuclear RNA export factor
LNSLTNIRQSAIDGNNLFIQVGKDDVPNFLHLDGFTYGPAKLSISESHEPWPQKKGKKGGLSESGAATKEKLQGVLFQRYDVNTRVLNLSALGQDEVLQGMGLFDAKDTAEKAFRALVHISNQQFETEKAKAEAIQGVSLASNALSTVAPVFDLADKFPQLKMLDLSNNNISNMRQLTRWRHRFRHLEVLVLTGNPIEKDEPNYKTELLDWFPKLQIINGEQFRSAQEIEAREAASRPTPIPQMGADFRDSDGVGEGFIRTFFPLFDSDRPSLLSTFYDEHTRFTVSLINNGITTSDTVPSWQPYLKFSRNMAKITTDAGRSQRLFEGAAMIADLWKQLPATRHPDLADFTKYIIDCHPLPGLPDPTRQSTAGVGGLILTIHGQFEEMDPAIQKVGMRSFSRTLVLGPGLPGRNPIRVVSDMLALRAFNPLPGAPDPATLPPAAAGSVPAAPIVDVEEQKKQMTMELTNRTKMTLEYSTMCLDGTGWDFNMALQAFEEKKVSPYCLPICLYFSLLTSL